LTSSSNSSAQIAGGVAVVGAIAAAAAIAPKLGSLVGGAPNASTATAASFLNRATFGADAASAQSLAAGTTDAWFQAQKDAAPSPGGAPGFWASPANFHLAWVDRRQADFDAQYAAAVAAITDPNAKKPNHRRVDRNQFQEGFWARAVTGDDQLRHRMALALSEIFVVSFQGSTITPRIAASWYDMLSARAFGSYVDLLKAVTLHPAMGLFLNIIGNTQADKDPTRHPDENYAREIMQLMSIGLVQLEPDGTPRTDAAGAPIPTYTHDDIAALAKVFTGWGWYAAKPTNNTFAKQPGNGVGGAAPDVQNLIPYPALHSQLSKTFLGATIPAYTGAAPTTPAGAAALADYQAKSLDTALKVIAAHPNVGPFIGRRLIQRFVTSNPSPAYVGRVAQAFNGDPAKPATRGDLFATLKAVLTDPEAQNRDAALASPTSGRLREPTLRMAHWLRASAATSQAATGSAVGNWVQFADLGDPGYLAQAQLEAPSVFNFWDPDFTPTGSRIAAAKLVAPEFQAVDALTVAAYANLMAQVVQNRGWPGGDVKVTYAQEIAALTPPTATAPDLDSALIDRINTLYFGGAMSPVLQGRLTRVLSSTKSTAKAPTADQRASVRLDKVRSALILTLTAPEYLVQR